MIHPPVVAPILQIGITGHRNLPGADPVLLQKVLGEVLDRFAAGARQALAAGWPQIEHPVAEIRCVSALALGADQLAAAAALARGWKLFAPLPFAREVYRNDFNGDAEQAAYDALLARADTVYELDGIAGRPDAYQAVGALVLEQSDILLAIWDGEAERGPGGTAEVVRDARAADIPVVAIAASAPHAVTIFAPEGAGTPEALAARVLALPHKTEKTDALALYYREQRFDAPAVARRLAAVERIALFHAHHRPRPPAAEPPVCGPESERFAADLVQVRAGMEPYLAAADRLAVRYATFYRASVTLKYLAVLPAVLAALITFTVPQPYGVVLGFAAQLVAVITFLIGYNDRRAGWHRRFIDYRYMAERLRYAPMMAMFGSTSTLPRLPPYQMAANSDWVNWYLHFAVRGLGLVPARRDPAFLDGLRMLLFRQLEEQIAFYAARAEDAELLASRLQKTGVALFVIGICFTVLGGGLKLAGASEGHLYPVVAALGGAIGGLWPAIFGLRSQREYQRLSERYDAMVRQLGQMETRLRRDGALRGQVERITREAVDTMLAEVSDWRVLIKARDFSPY